MLWAQPFPTSPFLSISPPPPPRLLLHPRAQHRAYLKPQFGIPIACRTYTTFWAKKMKKKTKKLNELSLLEGGGEKRETTSGTALKPSSKPGQHTALDVQP